MKKQLVQFLQVYTGYSLVYGSYKLSLYMLNQLFNMVDEIIGKEMNTIDVEAETMDIVEAELEPNLSNNANLNLLSDVDDDLVTKHTYTDFRKVLEITHGGDKIALIKKTAALNKFRKDVQNLLKITDKVISSHIIKPIANLIGFLLLKFPAFRGIYQITKNSQKVLVGLLSLSGMRLVARFDYWAILINDALPRTGIMEAIHLSSIYRSRIGKPHFILCFSQSQELISLVADQSIDIEEKSKRLITFFTAYEMFPEGSNYKKAFFLCIGHLLVMLFALHGPLYFGFALTVLKRLLDEGRISYTTYLELISILLRNGISPVDCGASPQTEIILD